MADTSIINLNNYVTVHPQDWLLVVDTTDTTMSPSGSDKRVQLSTLFAGMGVSGSGTVQTVSIASANGLGGTVSNPTTTPIITLNTSITGMLKGNGTAISQAVSGVDYQTPVLLTTNGSNGAATFNGQTLNIPQYSGGGAGTVTNVSVIAINGFSGSVSNPTTTPALTLNTTINGIVKGNGSSLQLAVSGTDYQPVLLLTTNGGGGPSTFDGKTLNIPNYTGGGGGSVGPGTAGQLATFLTSSTIGSTVTGITMNSHFGGYGGASIVAASAIFNAASNDKWQLTLTVPTTSLVINNANSGQIIGIRLTQDNTGNRLVNWNPVGNINWIGTPGYIAPVLGASSGAVSKIYLEYLGNNSYDGFTSGASAI